MAKRRFQDPELEQVGNWWQIRIYQDEYSNGRRIRKRKRIKLAPATMAVREVQKIKAEYLRPLNQGLVTAGSATMFEDYVRNVYDAYRIAVAGQQHAGRVTAGSSRIT